MQPCLECGGTVVDAAGYCTTCRTYRGLPAPEVAPTVTYRWVSATLLVLAVILLAALFLVRITDMP